MEDKIGNNFTKVDDGKDNEGVKIIEESGNGNDNKGFGDNSQQNTGNHMN